MLLFFYPCARSRKNRAIYTIQYMTIRPKTIPNTHTYAYTFDHCKELLQARTKYICNTYVWRALYSLYFYMAMGLPRIKKNIFNVCCIWWRKYFRDLTASRIIIPRARARTWNGKVCRRRRPHRYVNVKLELCANCT